MDTGANCVCEGRVARATTTQGGIDRESEQEEAVLRSGGSAGYSLCLCRVSFFITSSSSFSVGPSSLPSILP